MNVTEWTNLLKTRNAKNRLAGGTNILLAQAALSNLINQDLTALGANPALWDYPAGTSMGSSLTGITPSTVVTLPTDYVKNPLLIRITTTVGATPTATFAVQGSKDNSVWFAVDFCDSATPDTFGQATFTMTTATTVQKMVKPGTQMRYLRFNITANTNVTVTTADVSYL
jgi:hypothetical protein